MSDEKRLTLEEWLIRTNELGYYITKPRIVYEPSGWQHVLRSCACVVALGLFGGLIVGSVQIGLRYVDCTQEQPK